MCNSSVLILDFYKLLSLIHIIGVQVWEQLFVIFSLRRDLGREISRFSKIVSEQVTPSVNYICFVVNFSMHIVNNGKYLLNYHSYTVFGI